MRKRAPMLQSQSRLNELISLLGVTALIVLGIEAKSWSDTVPASDFGEAETALATTELRRIVDGFTRGKPYAVYIVPKLFEVKDGSLGVGPESHILSNRIGYILGEDVVEFCAALGKPERITLYNKAAVHSLIPLFENNPTNSNMMIECLFVGTKFAIRIDLTKQNAGAFDLIYGDAFSKWISDRMLISVKREGRK
jgi:hypothetical protein